MMNLSRKKNKDVLWWDTVGNKYKNVDIRQFLFYIYFYFASFYTRPQGPVVVCWRIQQKKSRYNEVTLHKSKGAEISGWKRDKYKKSEEKLFLYMATCPTCGNSWIFYIFPPFFQYSNICPSKPHRGLLCKKNQHEKTTFEGEPVWFGSVCLVQGGEDVRYEEALSGAHTEHRPHVFPLLRMRTDKF